MNHIKAFFKKIDFSKLKSVLIVSFCVFSVILNIVQICGSKKDSVIYFNEGFESSDVQNKFTEEIASESVSSEAIDHNSEEKEERPVKSSGLINLNTASKSELMSLKGIGESKASAIIEYREQYGKFVNIEEIKLVSGIGDKIFSNIKDYICAE